jgi:excinuclease UvrABC nuclease subunit
MSAKTIIIKFKGYWRDEIKSGVPAQSGVYCVYECKYHKNDDPPILLLKLIYIGEADNVRERIANHEKYQDWLKHVRFGNELCFSFGPVLSTDRERAEAAMIFKHKPPENEEYKYSFPFDQTTISLSGEIALLKIYFTVERTE